MKHLFVAFWLTFILTPLTQATEVSDGITYLNQIREKSGLIPLTYEPHLEKAAISHATYLIKHQSYGHNEKRGSQGYTGVTPSERIIAAGYPTYFGRENIVGNTASVKEGIDYLFSAIYHRFVFLDFDKDQIGGGVSKDGRKKLIQSLYVYDLGASGVGDLCQHSFVLAPNTFYVEHLCKETTKKIPKERLDQVLASVQNKNEAIVYYPYANQKDIWPAFYDESPDPLPSYGVSGFPVSVQFNPLYYHDVVLKSFTLIDGNGQKLKEVKVIQKSNDPNHRFSGLEFALMPLKRLEFGMRYTAVFEAIVDGKKIEKKWSFSTKNIEEPFYKITQSETILKLKKGATVILYVVPSHPNDIIKTYRIQRGMKVRFLDQNTLKVTLPSEAMVKHATLTLGKKKIVFNIQK